MRSKIKIGVIGLGWIGAEHARNILANPDAELTAIANPHTEKIDSFIGKTGVECRKFTDWHKLLDADVDAVVIASPNNLHREMCVESARKGKHIFCEKPMAITPGDCREIRDVVRETGVKFLIGYHRRLNPLYLHVKSLFDSGRLGRPVTIESDYIHHVPGDWDIWTWAGKRDLAGSLFHAGCGHNVDLIRHFCGDVEDVVCFKDILLPRRNQVETEDTAFALFRFKSGAIGKVHLCIGAIAPFSFNFKLFGTAGTVVNNRVWFDSIPRFNETGHEDDCIELPKSWMPNNVQGGIGEPWNKLMDHFVEVVQGSVSSMNDVESACKTSMACFAAVESAETGQVVAVDKSERE